MQMPPQATPGWSVSDTTTIPPIKPDLELGALILPISATMTATRTREVLDTFTVCFDRHAARHARQDPDARGRWLRAYRAVSLRDDLGLGRSTLATLIAAAWWARNHAPEALEPLETWHREWLALTGNEADPSALCRRASPEALGELLAVLLER